MDGLPREQGQQTPAAYDVERVRADFPILARRVHEKPGKPGKPLVYLDTAASAQKPRVVLDALMSAYSDDYANVHRGLYELSARSTEAFEAARTTVQRFLNAGSDREIIFTKSTTEAINLVAHSFGEAFLTEGDEVMLTEMEHHANIVPWQLLRARKGIKLVVVPVGDDGALDLAEVEARIGPRTKLISVTHVSNVLGTVVPVKELVALAHAHGVPVMVDGSQGAVHMPVDVRDLDCDFYALTGHKLYGPTGVGVLYGKEDLLDRMPPFLGGGDMIRRVTFEETTFAELPAKFEAGTPPIAETIGLAAAMDYLEGLGRAAIAAHEHDVGAYAMARLAEVPGLTLYGTTPDKAAIASFTLDCAHAHDISTLVDMSHGVALRAGHHCAQPLMDKFGVAATTRASIGLYTTRAEIDVLVDALLRVREIFA